MSDNDGQRVHSATPRRRQAARMAGQVAASRDLSSAATLLVGLAVVLLVGPAVVRYFVDLASRSLGSRVLPTDNPSAWHGAWQEAVLGISWIAGPAIVVMAIAPLAVHLVQTRFLLRLGNVAPDLSRVDFQRGFQQVFSSRRFAEASFGAAKMVVVVSAAAAFLYSQRTEILAMQALDWAEMLATFWTLAWQSVFVISIALLLLAAVDYALRRWSHERALMMTPQELRQEIREQEGDPKISSRRRTVQKQLAAQRLAQAVAETTSGKSA